MKVKTAEVVVELINHIRYLQELAAKDSYEVNLKLIEIGHLALSGAISALEKNEMPKL
jgi:hypothetical protein